MESSVGSVAELIAAVAAVAGTGLSLAALVFGIRANRTAKEANDVARATAEAAGERDREREMRRLAGSVAAWWAAEPKDTPNRRFGVVVSNQSDASAVFHDVDVAVVDMANKTHQIHFNVLPPGQHFVKHELGDRWSKMAGIPVPVLASDMFQPFTVARDRSITSIEFSDGLGYRWSWTPGRGLSRTGPST